MAGLCAVLPLAAVQAAPAANCVSSARLQAAGLGCTWQQQINPADNGRAVTNQVLFGTTTGTKAEVKGATSHAFIGRAPDGSPAIEIRVPQGDVPGWEIQSNHLGGRNITHAGLAVDVWVPDTFRYPSRCIGGNANTTGAQPGQGRWPFGLWVGGTGYAMAGGVPLSNQNGASIRLNRSGGNDGQLAGMGTYVYNLNRGPVTSSTDACEADGVCSGNCRNGTTGSCFGYYNPNNVTALPRGRWVTIEMDVRMNDPRQNNGHVRWWRDGVLQQSKSGFDFGRDRGWFIRGFYSWEMWHCQPSPQRQSYWFRNLRLYANDVVAPAAMNGVCGAANGTTGTTAPSGNLCSSGTVSAVSGAGPWRWNCAGSNGGTTASCVRNLTATTPTTPPATSTSIRIEAGSATPFTATGGHVWQADRHFVGGQAVDRGAVAIAGTENDRIYQTERWGLTGYNIPIPNGTYNVKLLFAETNQWITAPGQRVFGVTVEGTAIPDVDIMREVGHSTALVRSVDVTVRDGVLNIGFTARVQGTMINGLDINAR